MEILKQVIRRSIFIFIPAVVLSAIFIEPQRFPLGIIVGWLFGIINLRSLTKNVQGLVGAERATIRLLIMNLIRLIGLSAAIIMLVYYRVINVFGLLIGFTIVFIFIMIEGVKIGKRK